MLLITNMRKRDSAKMECFKKNKGGVYFKYIKMN